MKKITTVIFDVGNVVYEVDEEVYLQKMAEYFDVPFESFMEGLKPHLQPFARGEISETDIYGSLQKTFQREHIALPQESLFLVHWKDVVKPNKEVIAMIGTLKEKGYTVAALSNTNAAHAGWLQENNHYSIFSHLFLSHEIGSRKPEPRIYSYALEKLGVNPEETVFIDDKQRNVEAAEKLDIHAILFQGAEDLQEDLQNLGVTL